MSVGEDPHSPFLMVFIFSEDVNNAFGAEDANCISYSDPV